MGYWNNTGFVAKTLDDYKTELQAAFVRAYGEDFALDDSTPQGILITGLAEMLFNTDMDGVEAFSRMNLNSAGGVLLDLIGSWRGIERSQGTPQIATVRVTCNASNFNQFTIDEGTTFYAISSTDTFVLPVAKTIESTTGTLVLNYTETGDSSLAVGNKLTVEGYGQITDLEVISLVPGQPAESDLEYRRRLQVEYPVAQGTVEFVQNKIYETGLVYDVGNNYNDTDETVGVLPAYTTEWMAVPKEGVDLEAFKERVAKAIIDNKIPGAPTYGNTTVTTLDPFGSSKTVNFTIPDKIELEIYCQVATPEGSGILNLSNVPEIRLAIMEYINNLRIGQDVSFSRCIAPLSADTGFDIVVFKIREKAAEGAEEAEWVVNGNYTIGLREYAHIAGEDIKVEI